MKKQLRIKETSLNELNNFSKISDSIRDMISKYWEGDLAPKGYEEFTADYEDYDGMGEEEYDLEFDGLTSETAGTPSIEDLLNLPSVAYSDIGQGRKPIETLIGAVLGYGMMIGKARANKHIEMEFNKLEGQIKRKLQYLKDDASLEENKRFGVDTATQYIESDLSMFKDFAIKYD